MPSGSDGYEIVFYQTAQGEEPVTAWLLDLDPEVQRRVLARFDRAAFGNLGDHKSVGEGLFEFRYHFGSGYRVYFGIENNEIVILLVGGDKKTQKKDIKTAKQHWEDYKND